jgi:hypothetical protein
MKLFSEKIARELAEGKRIADTEVIILLLDQMNKRMDIMNESLNRRINELRGTWAPPSGGIIGKIGRDELIGGEDREELKPQLEALAQDSALIEQCLSFIRIISSILNEKRIEGIDRISNFLPPPVLSGSVGY